MSPLTSRICVFDLDGVITDPETSKVNEEVLKRIASDLKQQRAVAFNTGRPYEWVTEHVIPGLRAYSSPEELERLLVVAEMGGVLGTFQNGELCITLDQTLSLPGAFIEDIERLLDKQIADGERYADYVTWDGLKKTMGTIVKWEHVRLADFNRIRPLLATDLEKLMEQHQLTDFIIGQTTIATDIQHKTAGKHKGAQQVLAWLQEKQLQPQAFYAFGDSISDKAMAEEFAATGAKTIFVFVGAPAHAKEVTGTAYETVITNGRHDIDVAEYLARLG